MKNRKILYLFLSLLLITFFGISYSLTHYINKNDLVLKGSSTLPFLKLTEKSISEDEKSNLLQTSMITNFPVIAEGTKFVFKIKYKDKEVRNMVLEKHFNGLPVLIGKTESKLNEFFKNQGYTVFNMSDNEIVFVNNSNSYSYSADRYFLGVFKDFVTIYKTDKNGDITAHKLFNSNVYAEDGKQQQYEFEARESGELQYIRIDELKEKEGLVDYLIRGSKDNNSSNYTEVDEEFEKGEFKTYEKAFDYAMGLLKS